MKTKFFTLAALLISAAVNAQTVVIDSLDGNGNLTATVPSNSVYTIEWKGALDSPSDWSESWYQHRGVASADGSVDVEVPMAFRLTCWTNGLFLDLPVGRTYEYAVSNQVNIPPYPQTWTQLVEVVADTVVPLEGSSYRLLRVEEFYDNSDFPALGAQGRGMQFMRLEEDRCYQYDQFAQVENLVLQDGPVNTTWSYYSSTAETIIDFEILAVEDVTVSTTNGPVIYSDCIKIQATGQPNGFNWQTNFSNRVYTEWIEPGGYIVKRENYWIANAYSNAAPVIYELQGWTDQ